MIAVAWPGLGVVIIQAIMVAVCIVGAAVCVAYALTRRR